MKPRIHLAHANGYPPGCYRALLAAFEAEYACMAMPYRPVEAGEAPAALCSWHDLTDDLIAGLRQSAAERPWIGIGHSLGGIVTLFAALREPSLFSHIVLLDPVVLPRRWYLAGGIVPLRFRHHLLPLSRQALRRRDHWPDAASARAHLRRKAIFRRIPDPVFDDLIAAMLRPDSGGGVTLAFPRQWESRVYITATSPYEALRRLKVPFLIIRGAASDTIRPEVWARMQRLNPRGTFVELPDSGHLLPFERPAETARLIRDWLSDRQA